jgi:hypothetical protein
MRLPNILSLRICFFLVLFVVSVVWVHQVCKLADFVPARVSIGSSFIIDVRTSCESILLSDHITSYRGTSHASRGKDA